MATGTVKFFNSQKGFGFIQQDGGGPDVFVHVSAVERAGMRGLVEGQKLTFDIEADRRSGKSAAANLQNARTTAIRKSRCRRCRVSVSGQPAIHRAGRAACRPQNQASSCNANRIMTMARKPGTRVEFVLFDVLYEDGSQRSNRKVPSAVLGGLDDDTAV